MTKRKVQVPTPPVFREAVSTGDGWVDVTGTGHVEILISDPLGGINGNMPVLHVNTQSGIKLRICRIAGEIIIRDTRHKPGC